MRVIVCGGRNFTDYDYLVKILDDQLKDYLDDQGMYNGKDLTIVHGAARGADSLADKYAVNRMIPVEDWRADWDTHGKAAGIMRNRDMLESGVDLVIAFPGGRGTANMVMLARGSGVETIVCTSSE